MMRRKTHKPYSKPARRVWTKEELSLLGQIPDREVARLIGRTVGTVRQARFARGIVYVASNRFPFRGEKRARQR
jgi:hypothetical protein